MKVRDSLLQNGSCHHLLTFKLFQTCMSFFLLLNTQDILKNVDNQTVWLPTLFKMLNKIKK